MSKNILKIFFVIIINFIICCDNNKKDTTNNDESQSLEQEQNKSRQTSTTITSNPINKKEECQFCHKMVKDKNIHERDCASNPINKKEECQFCHKMVKDKANHEKTCKKNPKQSQSFIVAIENLKNSKNNLNTQARSDDWNGYKYKLPDDIFKNIDFTKKDFKDLNILGSPTNTVLTNFTYMVVDILGELFSTPRLMNELVKAVIENQNQTIQKTITKYIYEEIIKQADKYKRSSSLITFYFSSQQGTALNQKQFIRDDLQNLLYKKANSKKLWMSKLEDYIKNAIDAGEKHWPPKKFIEW